MQVCNCTLYFSNPEACKICQGSNGYETLYSGKIVDYVYLPVQKIKKKITKEYNEKGNLIKETIEVI